MIVSKVIGIRMAGMQKKEKMAGLHSRLENEGGKIICVKHLL